MLIAAVFGTLVLAAGIAIIATIATLGVHDALRKLHRDILSLDTVFAHVFGAQTARERERHGSLSFFLVAWAVVLAFFLVWRLPLFDTFFANNAAVVAGIFGLGLYFALMVVFLPIYRLGAFGRAHDRLVPYWGAFFVAFFVLVVSILVGITL
jgi:hypothetical protein